MPYLCHKCSEVISQQIDTGIYAIRGCKLQPNLVGSGMHSCPLNAKTIRQDDLSLHKELLSRFVDFIERHENCLVDACVDELDYKPLIRAAKELSSKH